MHLFKRSWPRGGLVRGFFKTDDRPTTIKLRSFKRITPLCVIAPPSPRSLRSPPIPSNAAARREYLGLMEIANWFDRP